MPERNVTLSIVSHGQNMLVNQLLGDVQRMCARHVALVLTQNVPDPVPFATGKLDCPAEIILNPERRGFGANHNAAFSRCRTPYFCVCNPDIRLPSDPFPPLLESLADRHAGAAGPLVRSPNGRVEDSARKFPTITALLRKLFAEKRAPDYATDRSPQEVDWIGGMFMLFPSVAFRAVRGFDEAYFLYYEDIDLCRRLHEAGHSVVYDPRAEVVHDARRTSRRNPKYLFWHVRSILRYLSTRY